jgi:hypothetical protein
MGNGEIGMSCSTYIHTYIHTESAFKILFRKHEEKRTIWETYMQMDNIKMEFNHTWFEGVEWIQ